MSLSGIGLRFFHQIGLKRTTVSTGTAGIGGWRSVKGACSVRSDFELAKWRMTALAVQKCNCYGGRKSARSDPPATVARKQTRCPRPTARIAYNQK